MQKDQLRLNLHIKSPRGLEQAQQEVAEGDLAQGLLENRLADGTDGRFELLDPGVPGYPARLHVELGDPPVVPVEEGQQVLRQVAFVFLGQGAHDAEVDRDVAPVGFDEDVARVHVGVEKVVLEDLGEEDLDTPLSQQLHANALPAQGVGVAHRGAADALHHQHVLACQVPVDLGDVECLVVQEVAPQLGGVGGLAHQVELVEDGLLVLLDHFDRVQATAVLPVLFRQPRDGEEQVDVAPDGLLDVGAQHLDHDALAGLEPRRVDLGDGGRGERRLVELLQQRLHRLAEGLLDDGAGAFAGKGRNPVLQLGQLLGQVVRQQIATGGEDLAEFDEDRSQVLQGTPDAHGIGCAVLTEPVPGREVDQEADRAEQVGGENHLVQTVFEQHQVDMDQA